MPDGGKEVKIRPEDGRMKRHGEESDAIRKTEEENRFYYRRRNCAGGVSSDIDSMADARRKNRYRRGCLLDGKGGDGDFGGFAQIPESDGFGNGSDASGVFAVGLLVQKECKDSPGTGKSGQ